MAIVLRCPRDNKQYAQSDMVRLPNNDWVAKKNLTDAERAQLGMAPAGEAPSEGAPQAPVAPEGEGAQAPQAPEGGENTQAPQGGQPTQTPEGEGAPAAPKNYEEMEFAALQGEVKARELNGFQKTRDELIAMLKEDDAAKAQA